MWKVKYCVASIYVNCFGESSVSYYAFCKGYGLHTVQDINDEYVLWYDTKEETKKHIMNSEGECVISFGFEI